MKSTKTTSIYLIVLLIVTFIMSGCAVSGSVDFKDKPTENKATTPNGKPPTTAPVVEKTNTGTITGSDVSLRSEHSIASSVVTYMDRGTKVTVLEEWSCNNPNEAVLNTDTLFLYHNGRRIDLQKGQAVSISKDNGNYYDILINIDGRWYEKNCEKYMIRRIFGEKWYKITIPDGKTGWVFGQFIGS